MREHSTSRTLETARIFILNCAGHYFSKSVLRHANNLHVSVISISTFPYFDRVQHEIWVHVAPDGEKFRRRSLVYHRATFIPRDNAF